MGNIRRTSAAAKRDCHLLDFGILIQFKLLDDKPLELKNGDAYIF